MSKALLSKYTGLITDKIMNLSKKEQKAICSSLNSFNENNQIRLSKNDTLESLGKKYKMILPEECIAIINSKTTVLDNHVLIVYAINRILIGKPTVKIEKLSIGEYDTLLKTLKDTITTTE